VLIAGVGMPIYEFRCQRCQHVFEVLCKLKEQILPSCEACADVNVERVVSLCSFSLQGGGWAADGYQRKADTGADVVNGDND